MSDDWGGGGARVRNLERGSPPTVAAGTDSVTGIIETLRTRTESMSPSNLARFGHSAASGFVPLLARIVGFLLFTMLVYWLMVQWTGHSLSTFTFYEFFVIAGILLFLRLFGRAMFPGFINAIIGSLFGIVDAFSNSLRRMLETLLTGGSPRNRDVTVYDITLLELDGGETWAVRMYGRLTGAALLEGQRVTFQGVRSEGVFLAFGGINHAYDNGEPFTCRPSRR